MTCIKLALEIGVEQQSLAVIENKTNAEYDAHDCRVLLTTWWKTKRKTAGTRLYWSLANIGKKAIADRHKDVLGQKGLRQFQPFEVVL